MRFAADRPRASLETLVLSIEQAVRQVLRVRD
jgi:hypothetical protein